MHPALRFLPIVAILTACQNGDRPADTAAGPASPPAAASPVQTTPAPLPPLPLAERPLAVWLPPPCTVPDLPPPIAAADVAVDLGGGRILRPAALVRTASLHGEWRCSGLTTSATRFPADAQEDRGYAAAAFDDAGWDRIAVPLDWYRKYPKARDPKAPFVLGWYRRSVDIAPAAGDRTVLRFGVVGYEADLWVNGKPAGSHHGDFTPWEVDISNQVVAGANVLALRVRSDLGVNWGAGPAWHAYGSQWSPDNIKGGIWQPCELRLEPAIRVTALEVSPQPAAGTVRLDWRILNHGPATGVTLRAVIHGARQGGEGDHPGDAVVATLEIPAGASTGSAEVAVPGIHPWSLDAPHLYRATLVALAGDRPVAVRSERFGYRSFAAVDGGFRLNGRPVWLAGENLAAKNYGGNGETPEALRAHIISDLTGLKRNGYRIFRNAHMPIIPEVLDRADELGLMVFNEWAWSFTKNLDPVEFPRRNPAEIAEWVARDHNHPSVVMWSCGNEVNYDQDMVRTELDRQVRLVRSLDRQHRPVSTFSGAAFGYGSTALDTDVLDLHDYRGLSEGPWTQWERNSSRVYRFLDKVYGAWRPSKPFIVWEAVGFSWGEKFDASYTAGDPEVYVRYAQHATSWGSPEVIGFAGTIGVAAALDPKRGNRLGRKVYGRRIGEFIRCDPDADGWAPWFQDPSLEEARQWTQPVFAALRGANRIAPRHPMSGAALTQDLIVVNHSDEVLHGATARLAVAGADGAERELAAVALPDLPVMGRHEQPVSFTMPAAATSGWCQLRVAIVRGTTVVSRLGYDLHVAPVAQPRLAGQRRIALLPSGDANAVRRWLGDLGLTARQARGVTDLADTDVAIVAPGARISADDGYTLRAWVRGGGDLLVLEQPAGEVAALRQTAAAAANSFVDLVVPAHPLFAGLSPEAFDTSDHPDQGMWVKAGLTPITANVLAARGPFLGDHGATAVVSEGTLGRGRILASQLLALEQWNRDSVATTYLRNLAAYLLAPGAKPVVTARPWQELGGGLAVESDRCRAIDLSAAANRAFADEKAEDGVGGWTDQGGNDFRMMPLGQQRLQGVPFTILDPAANAGHSCLVLGGAGRPAFPRQAEGIPVGFATARMFFLHTAAWVGGYAQVAMTYRIRYADGQSLDVPVRAGLEIADWWNPSDLPAARLGLSKTNDQLRDVGLFLMPWENPRPDVVVTAIDVVSSGTMVPIVVAITAEASNPKPARFDAAGDPARWGAISDRPLAGATREGPGRPAVAAAAEAAPGGAKAVRIEFPAPTEIQGAALGLAVPVVLAGLPADQRPLLADGSRRYLTMWIKAETAGSLDVVLPRQDWQEMLETTLAVDPAQGWRKVRMALAGDLQLGLGKNWEAKDLRGELLIYHGRRLRPGAPLPKPMAILIADPRLE